MELYESPEISNKISYGNCQWFSPLTEPNEILISEPTYKSEKQVYYAAKYGEANAEFIYDFTDGGEADGWLHALGRYQQQTSGHEAETIFGAHIYNTPIVYKDEPQSYASKPPGLSTRLFLRLAPEPLDTLCHLIYPASLPWHPKSATVLSLCNKHGKEVARREIAIPCSGSLYWRANDMFHASERVKAGDSAFVLVSDPTCRLFGFHGQIDGKRAFSLDHMFGF